jgi:CHASE2 domain-containing sensor protein/serine/threonine-protein kinase RIO1
MEYIVGARPITQYVRDRDLGTHERLELFAKVCDAVHHGHRKGIIHRDLKPGNILVDSQGQPRIIDFGVARATDSDLALTTLQTDVGQLVGTLHYMSPEQCAADPHDIDTRSDVYTLGVVLYELLSGKLPYDVRGSRVFEATRVIREQEPVKLTALDKTFKGDIETIVLRALAKDRERRYQSAEALGTDIQRYLRGEPIEARRDSVAYLLKTRCHSLTRRHRITSYVGVIALSVLLTQIVGVPLIFEWTSANKFFEGFVTSAIPMEVPGPAFDTVRMIALTDDTDIEAIARREGLEGVTVENLMSWRLLHGRLMEKLASSQCAAVVFDIMFKAPTPFDGEFVKGVEALKAEGIEAVVGVATWELDSEGFPELSREIAVSGVSWGCVVVNPSPPELPFVAERAQTMPQPSLALATLVSLRHPGTEYTILLDRRTESVEVRYWTAETTARQATRLIGSERIPLTARRSGLDPRSDKGAFLEMFGLGEEDVLGFYLFDVPPTDVLSASTIAYEDVLSADEDQLRAWFSGQVIVVGNNRGNGEDHHELDDGRVMPMSYVHAAAIDALLRGVYVLMPRATGRWLLPLAGAVLGCLAGILAGGRLGRCFLVGFGLTVVLFLVSIAAFWRVQYLFDPLVPVFAMLLAGGLSLLVRRTAPIHWGNPSKGG